MKSKTGRMVNDEEPSLSSFQDNIVFSKMETKPKEETYETPYRVYGRTNRVENQKVFKKF